MGGGEGTAVAEAPRLAASHEHPGAMKAAWNVLLVAVGAQIGMSLLDQGIPTLTGFIKADLGVSAAVAGLAVSSFAFGRIAGSYWAGIAADRLGERRVLLAGALTTGVVIACAVLTPGPEVFGLLALAGLTSAASTPAGGRLVLHAFPRRRRGLALSIRQCGIPLGGMCAAVLLPRIAHVSSWRWSLAVAAAVMVVMALPLLSTSDSSEPLTRIRSRVSIRDRDIVLLTAWGCLVVTGQNALIAFLALDLHTSEGLSLASAALFVAFADGFGIAGRVFWGALSDRLLVRGRKPLLLTLTAACLISALVLFAVPRSSPTAVMLAVAGLAGFALIGFQGLWMTMLAEAAGPARVGAVSGFAISFATLSVCVAAPLYGLSADLTGTYRAIWAVLACVMAVALVPALLVREATTENG